MIFFFCPERCWVGVTLKMTIFQKTRRGLFLYLPPERGSMANPRYANGALRRKYRARFKAIGGPCGICGGEIHYDEPSDAAHPWSFVIDEIKPISRWREFGYDSARQAAEDWNNLQAAHYCCNAQKSNKTGSFLLKIEQKKPISDGDW